MSTTARPDACSVCGRSEDRETRVELRPYGPGGSLICYACAMKPDRQAETKRQFDKVLDEAGSVGVLTQRGPRSFKP